MDMLRARCAPHEFMCALHMRVGFVPRSQNASPCANPFLIPGKSVDGPAIEWNMNDFPRSCPFVNKDIGVFDKDSLRKFDVNEGYPKVNPSFFSLRHTSI